MDKELLDKKEVAFETEIGCFKAILQKLEATIVEKLESDYLQNPQGLSLIYRSSKKDDALPPKPLLKSH